MTALRKTSRFLRILSIVGLPLFVACATGGQPNMNSALASLESAKSSLERAAHDKGGHRVRALELIDQAISEVQMGIQAGAEHR
jgi:hypothetical protein